MKRMIVGCGFLGMRVAQRWIAARDEVHVLTRSHLRAERLAARGLLPIVGDVSQRASLPRFPQVDTLFWAVGHDRESGRPIEAIYVDGLQNVLTQLDANTGRIIYTSSTGVYGQRDGSWVDESSPCHPQRAGGKACLAAEQLLLGSAWSDRTAICRLAGIYGPGRLPRLGQLQAGQPLGTDPEAVINLIHVEDAAAAIVRVAHLPLRLPRTYLIADGHPVTRRSFYSEMARLMNAPPPVFEPGMENRERRRAAGHKQVANQRMLEELGVTPDYPSYREGLIAIARNEMMRDP